MPFRWSASSGYLRLHGRNTKAWFSKAGRDDTYNYLYSKDEMDSIAHPGRQARHHVEVADPHREQSLPRQGIRERPRSTGQATRKESRRPPYPSGTLSATARHRGVTRPSQLPATERPAAIAYIVFRKRDSTGLCISGRRQAGRPEFVRRRSIRDRSRTRIPDRPVQWERHDRRE